MNCCLLSLVKLRSLVLQAEHNAVSFPKKEHTAETSSRSWNNGVHKKLPMLALDKGGGGVGWLFCEFEFMQQVEEIDRTSQAEQCVSLHC